MLTIAGNVVKYLRYRKTALKNRAFRSAFREKGTVRALQQARPAASLERPRESAAGASRYRSAEICERMIRVVPRPTSPLYKGRGFMFFAKNIWKNCVKADTLRQICYCSSAFSFASPKENAGASEMTTAERAAASDVSYPLCSFLPFQTANCIRGLAGISISLRTSLNRPRKPLRFSWIFPAIA